MWLMFAGVAVAFRFITFFPLTIDMDESTYLVIADHFLNGSILYKDVMDVKPPGIFIIFSAFQFLFGKSIFLLRLFGAVTIATSAFLVYHTKKNWQATETASILSALTFIFMFNFYFGFSVLTEIFFTFFTALAIWLYSEHTSGAWTYLWVGLALGLGFLVKLHVAFDALAIGVFIVGAGVLHYHNVLRQATLLLIGFLFPYGITHLLFWATGNYEYYYFITYVVPFNYSSIRDVGVLAKFFKDGIVTYLPFIAMGVMGALSMIRNKQFSIVCLLLLLFLFDWVAILATGKPHPHYWLQLALPVSLLAGNMIELGNVWFFFRRKVTKWVLGMLTTVYFAFLFPYYYKRYIKPPIHSEKIYEYLKPLVHETDRIYTGDGPQILYWLMDKQSPTPHIHQNHLTYPSKIATYEIDIEKEMNRILDTRPHFIILSERYPHSFVLQRVSADYEVLENIQGFHIYRLRKPSL